jgi:hypothetical protein
VLLEITKVNAPYGRMRFGWFGIPTAKERMTLNFCGLYNRDEVTIQHTFNLPLGAKFCMPTFLF